MRRYDGAVACDDDDGRRRRRSDGQRAVAVFLLSVVMPTRAMDHVQLLYYSMYDTDTHTHRRTQYGVGPSRAKVHQSI